jgi:hypothetical protein
LPHIQELAVITVAEMVAQGRPLAVMEEGQAVRLEAVEVEEVMLIRMEAQGGSAELEW